MVRRGEVRWGTLDPVVGHEQAGHRPVLVVSDYRFNSKSAMSIVVPITSRDKSWKAPIQIDAGLIAGRAAYALPGQTRSVSTERLGKVIGSVSDVVVERCLDAFLQICGRRPPRSAPANEGGTP